MKKLLAIAALASLGACVDAELPEEESAALASAPELQYPPSVAYSQAAKLYLVVWPEKYLNEDSNIVGVRIKPNGSIVDPTPIVISRTSAHSYFSKVASDGTDFMVVWGERPLSGNQDILGARVQAATGAVLDPVPLTIGKGATQQDMPAIAWNGAQYLVAWQDWGPLGSRVMGTLLSRAGAPTTPFGTVLGDSVGWYEPSIAALNGSFLVAWDDWRNGFTGVYAATVSNAGIVGNLGGAPISRSPGNAGRSSVASGAGMYWVVWLDDRNAPWQDVYGTPVSSLGRPTMAQDVGLVLGPSSDQLPAVSSRPDGTFVLTWVTAPNNVAGTNDVRAGRVTLGGVMNAFTITAAPQDQLYPALAGDGLWFMTAWLDQRNPAAYTSIFAAAIDPVVVRVPDFLVRN